MDHSVSFNSPQWLWLFLLLPLVWWLGRGSLRGLNRFRATLALALRTLVASCLILALAEIELVRTEKQLTVLFLVDRSLSVSDEYAQAAIDYVEAATREQAGRSRPDRAGVIVFGRDAAIEVPPFANAIPSNLRIDTNVDGEHTDLSKALRLAAATFPHDAAKRVVVLTDGNENLGQAREEAARLANSGIGIDVVPIAARTVTDVAVERVATPANIRQGEPFDLRIVLNNTTTAGENAVARGKLRLTRRAGPETELLSEQDVELQPGQQVFSVREEIESPDFYTYEAQFVPADGSGDRFRQNNRSSASAHIRGRGRVLMVEEPGKQGGSELIAERLKRENLEVEVMSSNMAFSSLADLQRYDTIVLNDVPRTSGEGGAEITEFSDQQVEMLVRNTRELGGGLVMFGGPNSYGAGGWANSELEKAMPVDFQIKSLKVAPSGALMLVMDRSGSMAEDKLAMGKAAAIQATRVLGRQDYIGVVTFDSAADWAVTMQQVQDPERIAKRINRISIGGGTYLWPGMLEGFGAMRKVQAAVKHMIILTDGQTQPGDYVALARRMRQQGMTVSCVAIGQDADNALLDSIARAGGGKFYHVDKPSSIPRIFMKEAVRVARPLIYEDPRGLTPQVRASHEILSGSESLPPITGFVMTTLKDNPLVEVPVISPKPGAPNNALLATWTYGLGRTVAWTSDVGQRWASEWTGWGNYDQFFSQMIRWSLRPTDDNQRFTLVTRLADDHVEVVVTAMQDDSFLNFVNMSASVVNPDLKTAPFSLEQVAPGRYRGQFPIAEPGSYFLSVLPGATGAPLRAGVTVPYSAEFTSREANRPLLQDLAQMKPRGGEPGAVVESPQGLANIGELLKTDVFRGGLAWATSRRDGWHLLVLCGALLFLLDVANRRVAINLQPARVWHAVAARIARRQAAEASPVLDRLRTAKASVGERIEALQATARFEAPSDQPAILGNLEAEPAAVAPAPETRQEVATLAPAGPDADSYTSRLLKAKKQVWNDRQ